MREITFRGYSKEWGWVYGDYQEPFGIYPPQIFPRKSTVDYDEFEGIVVIHETVGQYTGLTDKNGNRIFEGDILKFINSDNEISYYNVKWFNYRWLIVDGMGHIDDFDEFVNKNMFVVGNVHDTPELLEIE